jgi:membrane-associated protease RseP (regulator of RpoE activity)
MKTDLLLVPLLAVALAFTGCASKKEPKPTFERGWIGGDLRRAGHELRPPGRNPKVYVRQVYPGTPAQAAGLQPGDLVLALDGGAISSLEDFQKRIAEAVPGRPIVVNLLREGRELDVAVIVGCERYQNWKNVSFGFSLTTELDLLPDPNFRIGPVLGYKQITERKELNSPESRLERAARKPTGEKQEGVSSGEGWNLWVVVFGLGQYKTILSQEPVAAR